LKPEPSQPISFLISLLLLFLKVLKRGEGGFCLASFAYGRLLRANMITTPIMTITTITAAIPNSKLANDAKPETGKIERTPFLTQERKK